MEAKPYRGKQFGSGYSAEYLPPHQRNWRIVKAKGKVIVFSTAQAALRAAERAYWSDPKAKAAAGLTLDEEALADKLTAIAEDWLRSNRADSKAAYVQRTPGRRPVVVMPGKVARA